MPVGTQYGYSGMGYVLLASIAAIVSGQSFGDYLKAKVFDPLGMKHTSSTINPVPRVTSWRATAIGRRRISSNAGITGCWQQGDGGLFSTLDDLFLWDQALSTERLVPKAALKQGLYLRHDQRRHAS
jgi:CubicO group peptidase (beta-lactamase class C family)